jgi:hypothetical protein
MQRDIVKQSNSKGCTSKRIFRLELEEMNPSETDNIKKVQMKRDGTCENRTEAHLIT